MEASKFIEIILAASILCLNCVNPARSSQQELPLPISVGRERSIPFDKYAQVLREFVDHQGMVNYKELKARRQDLDGFLEELKALEPENYENWDEKSKIAFWVNAYNALTLKSIIDNYPIEASFFRSLRFPNNSIHQIPGVWDALRFEVMGRKVTLNEIEHRIIRSDFNEPRIHMTLVCAALACPPLRNEPYSGENLDSQMDDQTRRFLGDTDKFLIDRTKGRVYLSKIFDWYGQDFVECYERKPGFPGHGRTRSAVLNFISGYLNRSDREYLEQGDYRIDYLDYDWSLNQQES